MLLNNKKAIETKKIVAARPKVKFRNTVSVGSIVPQQHHIVPQPAIILIDSKHTTSEYKWIPVGSRSSKGGKTAGRSSKGGKAAGSSSKGGKSSVEGIKPSIANAYEALSSEYEDFVPMQYKTTWILDSASSGNYGDRRIKVKRQ